MITPFTGEMSNTQEKLKNSMKVMHCLVDRSRTQTHVHSILLPPLLSYIASFAQRVVKNTYTTQVSANHDAALQSRTAFSHPLVHLTSAMPQLLDNR